MKIDVNGVKANVVQKGAGRDVLMLHGWGCSTKLFTAMQDALCDVMRVTVIDFPGHGESDRPPQPWGVPEYAEWTMQLIDQLGIAPCAIVAHSFGARVTLWMASHAPEKFGRIVITGGAGLREGGEDGPKQSLFAKVAHGVLGGMKKMKIFGKLPDALNEIYVQNFGSADYKVLDDEMRKTFTKVVNQDLSACLPGIKSPTLLYWGEKDTATPLWMGKKMAAEIKDAALITVPDGTHYAYLEHLGEFTHIVRHFLTEEK